MDEGMIDKIASFYNAGSIRININYEEIRKTDRDELIDIRNVLRDIKEVRKILYSKSNLYKLFDGIILKKSIDYLWINKRPLLMLIEAISIIIMEKSKSMEKLIK